MAALYARQYAWSMPEHATVLRIVTLLPAAGHEAELEDRLRRQVGEISKAPGCFGAQACRSLENPGPLIVVSRWESQSALDDYKGSGLFTRIRSESEGLLSGPAEVEHLTSLQ